MLLCSLRRTVRGRAGWGVFWLGFIVGRPALGPIFARPARLTQAIRQRPAGLEQDFAACERPYMGFFAPNVAFLGLPFSLNGQRFDFIEAPCANAFRPFAAFIFVVAFTRFTRILKSTRFLLLLPFVSCEEIALSVIAYLWR